MSDGRKPPTPVLDELRKLGLSDEEITNGARFEVAQCEEDPRWEWIRIRQPRASMRKREYRLTGDPARWRAMWWTLASARGTITMLTTTLPMRIVTGLALHDVVGVLDELGRLLQPHVESVEAGLDPTGTKPKA